MAKATESRLSVTHNATPENQGYSNGLLSTAFINSGGDGGRATFPLCLGLGGDLSIRPKPRPKPRRRSRPEERAMKIWG